MDRTQHEWNLAQALKAPSSVVDLSKTTACVHQISLGDVCRACYIAWWNDIERFK